MDEGTPGWEGMRRGGKTDLVHREVEQSSDPSVSWLYSDTLRQE